MIAGKAERHHLKARRYFKKGEDHRKHNLVMVDHDCHRLFHRLYDDPRWSETTYLERMDAIQFGWGIFAPAFLFFKSSKVKATVLDRQGESPKAKDTSAAGNCMGWEGFSTELLDTPSVLTTLQLGQAGNMREIQR